MSVLIGDLMAMAETQEWRAREYGVVAGAHKETSRRDGGGSVLAQSLDAGFGVSKPWEIVSRMT